jgi:hypothetical protein
MRQCSGHTTEDPASLPLTHWEEGATPSGTQKEGVSISGVFVVRQF